MEPRRLKALIVEEECHEADANVQEFARNLVFVDEAFPVSMDWNESKRTRTATQTAPVRCAEATRIRIVRREKAVRLIFRRGVIHWLLPPRSCRRHTSFCACNHATAVWYSGHFALEQRTPTPTSCSCQLWIFLSLRFMLIDRLYGAHTSACYLRARCWWEVAIFAARF